MVLESEFDDEGANYFCLRSTLLLPVCSSSGGLRGQQTPPVAKLIRHVCSDLDPHQTKTVFGGTLFCLSSALPVVKIHIPIIPAG